MWVLHVRTCVAQYNSSPPPPSGLEILGELAWCLSNEALLATTPADVYHQIIQLLLIADCELVISSLETLYHLSFYGADIAEDIVTVSNSIEILMHLLTVRVESFGAEALKKVKLVGATGEVASSSTSDTQLLQIRQPTSSEPSTSKSFVLNTSSLAALNLRKSGITSSNSSPVTVFPIAKVPQVVTGLTSPLATNQRSQGQTAGQSSAGITPSRIQSTATPFMPVVTSQSKEFAEQW